MLCCTGSLQQTYELGIRMVQRYVSRLDLAEQMRRRVSALTLIGVMLTTVSCAPLVVPIYRASASDGEILRAHLCPPEPHSVIRFERHGVLVSARAFYKSDNQIWVRTAFEVPEGKVVRLLDHVVKVSVPARGSFEGDLSGGRIPLKHEPDSPSTPMMGETIKHKLRMFEGWPTLYDPPGLVMFAKTPHASYWFDAFLSVPKSDAFTLKLPRFLVNDVEVELPVINFTRHIDFYIAPMNC